MVGAKSNIDSFIKNFQNRIDLIKFNINDFAYKLGERISQDMLAMIISNKAIWSEDNSDLDSITTVDFAIKRTGVNSVRVDIGNNLPKFQMLDGTLVNPVFFIEFGFGVVGEDNPKQNYYEYDWGYNLNMHYNDWFFRGTDGNLTLSSGREGINFLYLTLKKYREEWKDYLLQLIRGSV